MSHKKNFNLDKTVILMYEDEGLTITEIAKRLNKPLKQIEKIVNENCNFDAWNKHD